MANEAMRDNWAVEAERVDGAVRFVGHTWLVTAKNRVPNSN